MVSKRNVRFKDLIGCLMLVPLRDTIISIFVTLLQTPMPFPTCHVKNACFYYKESIDTFFE